MNLQSLKQKFDAIPGFSASERGTGDAKFLYVTSAKRAVEVAESDEGIWIEYWDDTDKEDEKQIKEEIVASEQEALTKIKEWLLANTEPWAVKDPKGRKWEMCLKSQRNRKVRRNERSQI